MTLSNFRTSFNTKLLPIYPKTEVDAFFFRIIEYVLNLEVLDVFTKQDLIISDDKISDLENIVSRLAEEEPIQYILGHTNFYGYEFKVTTDTLIPRPETEELVSWVKDKTPKNATILDIGTGSGCIAITLKKELPSSKVTAIDFSKKALQIASKNAQTNKVNINFIQKDILTTDSLDTSYDIIVSNPPYVRDLEKNEIKNNVLLYEPHSALFVSNTNPLLFYDKIADLAKQHLSKNGLLFFEINQYLEQETLNLIQEKGFNNVELKKDLFGNPRMIKAEK